MLAGVLSVIACLYGPFVDSPAVFDDANIFGNLTVFDHAQRIFSAYPRTFPYFTLGLVHVLSGGDLAWNRWLNLALHGAVILALQVFLVRVLLAAGERENNRGRLVIGFVCIWMAINPVAVYGVGYLAQRTILLATLSSLVSFTLYLRAQQTPRPVDLLSSALLAWLAMMCKEHAILTPVAAIVLTPICCRWTRASVGRAGVYLAISLPGMLWVLLHRGIEAVGNPYEIYAGQVLSQVSAPAFPGSAWAMSAATQVLLFWKYGLLWLLPNPGWMSADLRIDFTALWQGGWAFAALAASLLTLGAAVVFWCRQRNDGARLVWVSALLFAAVPFAVELSTVKVQEPFVLYRCYLWMPAYALLLAIALIRFDAYLLRRATGMRRKLFWVAMAGACCLLFPAAQDRLRSFSSEQALWQDARDKLSHPAVAGADRVYYNLAGEAFKRREYAEALRLSDLVITQNPAAFQGYLARGTSLLALAHGDEAMRAFDAAAAHQPPKEFLGYIEFKRCGVIEARGDRAGVVACLRRAARLGYEMARFHLKLAGLDERGEGAESEADAAGASK
ncbi:hypothetical protein [Propionivibrio dicarboxylicus]|uniref:Uncharacterized protein n=1 Tax=Propionivibrio dicarboxylicus TaxID=83767 RepID=A0A1G8FCN2_9RHOO|nr:hypothetical protein [Propionivibrio dicarboxylicus]SDH79908.1 hypothetical protein SAMN05660652_02285 [Propionivibrio dicarboxylicus]